MTEYKAQTDILVEFNKNPDNYENFQEIKPQAVEQMLIVHNSLCSLVSTCISLSETEDPKKQMEFFLEKLRHNNYFNDFYEVDNNLYDILYLDRDVQAGELDELTLSVYIDDDNIFRVSDWISFGIKGEDYPMDCSIQDVIYTLDKHSKV